MNPILLDTHAAIWIASGVMAPAIAKLADEAARRDELLLSPISAWEIGMLVRKGRLPLAPTVGDYIRALFGQPGIVTATLTPAIALAASALPATLQGDPADRIIVATAQAYGARLMTRDRAILAYAKASKNLRCVPC